MAVKMKRYLKKKNISIDILKILDLMINIEEHRNEYYQRKSRSSIYIKRNRLKKIFMRQNELMS